MPRKVMTLVRYPRFADASMIRSGPELDVCVLAPGLSVVVAEVVVVVEAEEEEDAVVGVLSRAQAGCADRRWPTKFVSIFGR